MRCFVSFFDHIWVELLALFRLGDNAETKYGPFGEWTRINWTKSLITMGDPMGTSTWRFRLDEHNNLELYRGMCGHHEWSPDHKLSCWRDLEYNLKERINDKIDELLLEE